jgi:hypothetical protein
MIASICRIELKANYLSLKSTESEQSNFISSRTYRNVPHGTPPEVSGTHVDAVAALTLS